jgi:type II secretory pathway pseudopilin PulG
VIAMPIRVPTSSNDEGETLVELLMAVAIMGIAVVAIVGGIATTILMSDVHRKQATAGAYVRNYAEAVEGYVADGGFDASSPDYSPKAIGFTALPNGFVGSSSVRCWDSGGMHFSGCSSSCTVQQVTVKIASSDLRASETLLVTVRKP